VDMSDYEDQAFRRRVRFSASSAPPAASGGAAGYARYALAYPAIPASASVCIRI
jgi:hypothetical protein